MEKNYPQLTFRCSREYKEKIQQLAKEKGLKVGALIKAAINSYMEQNR